jgi:hypothetical protein
MPINNQQITTLLARWAAAVEPFWYASADEPELGCYGPGYIHWGVQSNFNYAAAMATLANQPGVDNPDHWRSRALSALRFALASHLSGERRGLNGERWGHSWISMLGIERAMHGVHRLTPHLTAEDHTALRRVLISEANWLLHHGHRGGHAGVIADLWNSSGRNAPESNIWAGALLWRSAQMFPDEANAPDWEERAHAYFINGVSVRADVADDTIVAGKPVRERHVGANFFPNYVKFCRCRSSAARRLVVDQRGDAENQRQQGQPDQYGGLPCPNIRNKTKPMNSIKAFWTNPM